MFNCHFYTMEDTGKSLVTDEWGNVVEFIVLWYISSLIIILGIILYVSLTLWVGVCTQNHGSIYEHGGTKLTVKDRLHKLF